MDEFLQAVIVGTVFMAIVLAGVLESPAWQDCPASKRRLSKLPEPVRAALRRTSGIISNRDVVNALAAVEAERDRGRAAQYRAKQVEALK